MAKSKPCRRAGSAAPRQTPIYGKTPNARLGNNPAQRIGKTISGSNPKAHQIGAPRDK